MSVLTAAALVVFIVEAQIPAPVPIPGAKLGLANTVTLFALFYRQKKENAAEALTVFDVFLILLCRIILGAVFSGRIIAFIYSVSGGMLGFAAAVALKRVVTEKQIWVCGVAGAVFHNIGQILAAALITGTPSVAALLPVMTVTAVITGIFTGLVAQFAVKRIGG